LNGWGHHTFTAQDGAEALAAIQQEAPSLILLDLELPVLSGIDVLKRLNGWGKTTAHVAAAHPGEHHDTIPPTIILTAFGTINRAVEAMKLGACDFLTKPFDPDHLGL
jgi:DNA-binding response OmpR family regulator